MLVPRLVRSQILEGTEHLPKFTREGRRAATEKLGPIVANFLVDVHLPQPTSPTDVVAYALDLEYGPDPEFRDR